LREALVGTLLAVFSLTSLCTESSEDADAEGNPLTRVLTMLNGMSERVNEHEKKEEQVFEKFMCYCKETGGGLEKSVAEDEEKLPQLTSSVEEATSSASQLENDLKEHKASKEAAQKAIAEQTEIRKTEAAAFGKESTELKANIGALEKAIDALEKSKGGKPGSALVQTSVIDMVRSVASAMNPDRLRTTDREQLASLLETLDQASSGEDSGDGSSVVTADSGEILGILKQMLENMQEDLKQMTSTDEARRSEADALKQAKAKEISTLSSTIEDKETRLADTKVQAVQQKSDITSTKSSLKSNSKLLADLNEECSKKKAEHEEMKKAFANELTALTETTRLLRSDEAQGLFNDRKTPSFLQIDSASQGGEAVDDAAKALKQMSTQHAAGGAFSRLANQAAATARLSKRGRQHRKAPSGFGKISNLITQMLGLLTKEQQEDDLKKNMCSKEIKKEEETVKTIGDTIEARTADIGEGAGSKEGAQKETEALKKGIKGLDKTVAEATKQRQEAHAVYVKLVADNHAALEVLRMAKTKLSSFYGSSSLVQKQPQPQQQQQQVALVQTSESSSDEFGFFSSGDAAEHEGSGANTGVQQEAKPGKLGKESGAVIEMLNQIEQDIKVEGAKAKVEEDQDQAEYEKFIATSGEKRGTDSKSLSVSVATLATVSENLLVLGKKKKALRGELDSTKTVVKDLHEDCDALLKQYDARKKRRIAEVEGLKRTQAVLTGASLAQVKKHKAKF